LVPESFLCLVLSFALSPGIVTRSLSGRRESTRRVTSRKSSILRKEGERISPFRTYDALVGVATHDFLDALPDAAVRGDGLPASARDRMLQSFVRSHYTSGLREILLALQHEYADWEGRGDSASEVLQQV